MVQKEFSLVPLFNSNDARNVTFPLNQFFLDFSEAETCFVQCLRRRVVEVWAYDYQPASVNQRESALISSDDRRSKGGRWSRRFHR